MFLLHENQLFLMFFSQEKCSHPGHPQSPKFRRGEATRLLKRFNEAKQLVEGLGPWTEHSEHPRLLKSAWANVFGL